jgi:hypothetical protein
MPVFARSYASFKSLPRLSRTWPMLSLWGARYTLLFVVFSFTRGFVV